MQWDLSGFYPITFDVHDHAWRQAIGALEARLLQFAWEWPVEFNCCGTEKKMSLRRARKEANETFLETKALVTIVSFQRNCYRRYDRTIMQSVV